jgi:hypothetical protein
MITQILRDQLGDLTLDTSTVCGLVFAAVLVLYFFWTIKPAMDSRIRINRQVRRRLENDQVGA